MKPFAFLAVLLVTSQPAAAEPGPKRAVDLRTNGDLGLTEKFADAVRAALPAAERLRVQTPEEDDDLALIVAAAAPDGKKFTWSADVLKVNTGFAPGRVGSLVGKCREDELADCAKAVVADADRAVRKAEKD